MVLRREGLSLFISPLLEEAASMLRQTKYLSGRKTKEKGRRESQLSSGMLLGEDQTCSKKGRRAVLVNEWSGLT